MQLIDSHCHLDFPEFDADRPQLLQQCQQLGIHQLILAAISREHWPRLWQLATSSSNPVLYASLGLHPYFLRQHQPDDLHLLQQWLKKHHNHPRLCAIGEIGLDFYLPQLDRQQQIFYFSHQLELACEFQLPVLLHVRKAHAQTLELLKQHALPRGGIVHAFSGSYEQAMEYIKLGFLLGIGGAYTWPTARRLHSTLQRLPLTSLALETDSPDMAPAFAANQRNNPTNLVQICHELATQLDIPAQQLAQQTSHNVQQLLSQT